MDTRRRWSSQSLIAAVGCAFLFAFLVRHVIDRRGASQPVHQSQIELTSNEGLEKKSLTSGPFQERTTALKLVASQPAYAQVVNGAELLLVNVTQPKAVLLVFHGCSHSALDWWYPSSTCEGCKGLPEEVAVTKQALKKGWSVIAFSSRDRERHQCWDASFPPENSVDTLPVINAFEAIAKQQGWQKTPRFALGGSSGGAFALHLALRLQLSGMCIQIMGTMPERLESTPHALDSPEQRWTYPPTAFVHMPRDARTAGVVATNLDILRKQGVKVTEAQVTPLPLTETFMHERVDDFGLEASKAVYGALRDGGALNATGYLVSDPRVSGLSDHVSLVSLVPRGSGEPFLPAETAPFFPPRASRTHNSKSSWQSLVKQRLPDVPVTADESALAEELNVAWAQHELASDPMDAIFTWLEAEKRHTPRLLAAVKP